MAKKPPKDADGQSEDMNRLRESEEQYRHLFEAASDAIFLIDNESGRILVANDAAAVMYGYSSAELAEKKNTDLSAEPSETRRVTEETPAIRDNAVTIPLRYHRKKDGTVFPVEITGRFINYKGRPVHIAAVRDITERKRIEEALRAESAFRIAIINRATEGLCVCHAVSEYPYVRFTVWNERMTEITGYTLEEINARGWYQTMYPDPAVQQRAIERMSQMREGLDILGEEWVVTCADGRQRALLIATSVIDLGGGNVNVLALMQDITERKQSELSLKESEEKFRRLYNETPVLLHSIDRNGIVVEVNDHWLKTLGYKRNEVIGRKVTAFYTEASRKYAEEVIWPAFFREGIAKDIQYQFVRKNGDVVDVILSATGERDAAGSVVRSQAVIVDVTEQKRMEEALRRSEERYRMLYEGSPVMMHSIDAEGKLISVSDHWLKQLGYTRAEVLGRRSTEFLDEQSRSYARAVVLPDFMRTGVCTDIPYTFLRKNGECISTLLSAIAERDEAGNVVRSLAVIIDITEKKQAEEKLRESEMRFRRLVEQSPMAILIIDRSGCIEYINKKHTEIVGYTVDEIPTLEVWWTLVYPDAETRQRIITAWGGIARMILSGEDVGPIERTIVCKDGSSKDVEMRFSLSGDRILAVFTDVSERKRIEDALRQSEERFRDLAESMPLTVFEMDLQGRFTYVNRAALEKFGYSQQDLDAGLTMIQVIAPGDRERAREVMARRLAGNTDGYFEYQGLRKDGTLFPITVASSPILRDGRLAGLRGIVMDLSERKQLEEERLKSQKLESIGKLAGGIAHDFNNLLQGIFGYISMAKMNIDDQVRSLELLTEAEKALHLSVNLTTQLLTFSKGGRPMKKPLKLRPVIENAVMFALSGSNTDYRIDIEDGLLTVDADEGQIVQVIQNIVLNADQSMPLGGTVLISARNMQPSVNKQKGFPDQAKYIEIAIRDSGVGIPEQYLSSIFDPYFTTKEKGSGIGLATTYSIIKNHDGIIDVESEVGKGSTFFVYLPGSEGKVEVLEAQPVQSAVRSGRVLVMDDDAMIRTIVGEMMNALGHEALCVPDGETAIEKYRSAMESGNPYDVVILDLTVRGGIGGEETIRRLLALDPRVKAIVSSGYSENSIMSDYQTHGFRACLGKPYRIEELRDMLNSLLL